MLEELSEHAKEARRSVIKMAHASSSSHTGSALSIVDILTVLYFQVMKLDPDQSSWHFRDRFVLSKGHASAALYAVLAERGIICASILDQYYCDGGVLPGHLDREAIPGIEASAGSLGHGLSLGIGMALAAKLDKLTNHIYVLVGDGELNEGSVWEGIMLVPNLDLGNITLIVDCNGLQGYGKTADIVDLNPLADKFEAFNWVAIDADGHDFLALHDALILEVTRPKVIIAHTQKGKGVSFMEDSFLWHYKSPNDEQLIQALKELS